MFVVPKKAKNALDKFVLLSSSLYVQDIVYFRIIVIHFSFCVDIMSKDILNTSFYISNQIKISKFRHYFNP